MSINLHGPQSELRGQIFEPLRMTDRKRTHSVRLDMPPTGELIITRGNDIDFDQRDTIFTVLPRGAITMRDFRHQMFGGRQQQGFMSLEDEAAANLLFEMYKKLKKQNLETGGNGWLDEPSTQGLLEMLSHIYRQAVNGKGKLDAEIRR